MFILASALWIRTSAYLESGTQSEEVSLLPKFKPESQLNDDFNVPMELFIPSIYLLAQLKRQIIEQKVPPQTPKPRSAFQYFVRQDQVSSSSENIEEVIRNTLYGVKRINTGDVLLLCELYHACGDPENGLKVLNHAVPGLNIEKISPEQFFYQLDGLVGLRQNRIDARDPRWEAIQMVAQLLYRLYKCESAAKYFYYAATEVGLNPLVKAALEGFGASCYSMLNRHMEFYVRLQQTNWDVQQKIGAKDINEVIKIMLCPYKKHTEEEIFCALSSTFNAKCQCDLLEYHQGNFQVHGKTFLRYKEAHATTRYYLTVVCQFKHRILADFAIGVGVRHEHFGMYGKAKELFKEAEKIFRDIQGNDAVSTEIAETKVRHASLAIKFGRYEDARDLCMDAKNTFYLLRMPSPPSELDCGFVLADAYLHLGEFCAARVELAVNQVLICQIYDEGCGTLDLWKLKLLQARCHFAENKHWLAKKECEDAYDMLAAYISEASKPYVRQFKEEVSPTVMDWLMIFPDEPYISSHPCLCETRRVLAEIYTEIGLYDEAEHALDVNLGDSGFKKAYGSVDTHPIVAKTCFAYAKLEKKRHRLLKAQTYCDRAIMILDKNFSDREKAVHRELHRYQTFLADLCTLDEQHFDAYPVRRRIVS